MSNFKLYHEHLKQINRLFSDLFEGENSCPLIYPLLTQSNFFA